MDESPVGSGILRLCHCWNSCRGPWVQWVTGSSASAALHLAELGPPSILRTKERKGTFASAPGTWAAWFLYLGAERCVLTGRHRAQKK